MREEVDVWLVLCARSVLLLLVMREGFCVVFAMRIDRIEFEEK